MSLNLYKISGLLGCTFLILAMNPFILWLTWPPLLNFPVYIAVIICFLGLLSLGKINITPFRMAIFILTILLTSHITLPILSGNTDLGRFYSFFVLSLIFLFPNNVLILIYNYFIKFIKIISLFSVIIFGFTAFVELPHFIIKNSTLILENTDYYYKLYGFIVSSTNTSYNFGGITISRICGIFPEPGHFATYLGAITLIEKLIYNKLSKVILICGVLTFSPVFYVSLILIVLYNFIVKKSFKSIRNYLFLICFLFSLSFLLPQSFIDQIYELAIGRNLGDGVESRLDERANQLALESYFSFSKTSEVWVGKGVAFVEELGIFSDFRGFIFKYGIIGLVLSLLLCFVLLKKSVSIKFLFLFVPFVLLIYIQRSWMFGSIYIYLLLLLFLVTFLETKLEKNEFYTFKKIS